MGILKIELEVPEFKEAVELSIILKKDGEVITSSSTLNKDNERPIWRQTEPVSPGKREQDPIWKQQPIPDPGKFIVGDDPTSPVPYCSQIISNNEEITVTSLKSSLGTGNFMNVNIDDL